MPGLLDVDCNKCLNKDILCHSCCVNNVKSPYINYDDTEGIVNYTKRINKGDIENNG